MKEIGDLPHAQELQRITAAYARRKSGIRYTSFEPATLLDYQERERKVVSILLGAGISSLGRARILDVGCGIGFWMREFVKWGARPEKVCGIDLLADRVAQAKKLCPSGVRLECGSATQLSFSSCEFDLVLQSTMFSSILEKEMKVQIAREMLRVLRPAGSILWYDFRVNNPRNPDVQGIRKKEVRELFPNCRIDFHTLTLAPPIARPVARVSQVLYRILSCITPLRTHYLGLITKCNHANPKSTECLL